MKVLYPVCTIFVLKIDIPMDILFLVGGLLLILLGANGLTDGAASVAKRFHIPSIVIGLTIVAFGTSAPELTVSISSCSQRQCRHCHWQCGGKQYVQYPDDCGLYGPFCPDSHYP